MVLSVDCLLLVFDAVVSVGCGGCGFLGFGFGLVVVLNSFVFDSCFGFAFVDACFGFVWCSWVSWCLGVG